MNKYTYDYLSVQLTSRCLNRAFVTGVLLRRARNVRIRAEHAAIPHPWFQADSAHGAVIDELSMRGRHVFLSHMSTVRARDGGQELERGHRARTLDSA